MKKNRIFKLRVYDEAAEVIEKVLIASANDFKTIITREAQQKGQIADPNVFYDKSTRTVVIEEYPQDKGTVLLVTKKGEIVIKAYSRVGDNDNYAKLEPSKGCYCVYVKRSEGIDNQVNVALNEDDLIEVFGKITNKELLESEKAKAEAPIAEMPPMKVSTKRSK